MVSQSAPNSRNLGKGTITEFGLTDFSLLSQLMSYKARVAGSYRAILAEDISTISSGEWLSPKIDGELWFLCFEHQKVLLSNYRGTTITGDIPILNDASGCAKNFDGKLVIAGELHTIVDGRRCRVGDLASILGGQLEAPIGLIIFSAFDLLSLDGDQQGYDQRLARLQEFIKPTANLKIAETYPVNSYLDIQKSYDEFVASGHFEGLVVRSRAGMIYKIKPSYSIDAVILGYTIKSDATDRVRSILLGLIHPDQSIQIWGACGNVGTDDDRKTLFNKLQNIKVPSSHRYASDTGGLYTFVKPEIVVEIKVTDLQAERSDGTPIHSMNLTFDGQSWTGRHQRSNASPIHPVLIRLRDDKHADNVDARIAQIQDWLIDTSGNEAVSELPKSNLIRREVWTKDNKGKVAVRKLLVWKTNKSSVSPLYSEYVVHWTDYSPGRGTPLDREVRLAMNDETAFHIADTIIAENIKKGWEKR